MPVYGLAENSVGLAFPSVDRGPLIDRIQRDPFMRDGQAIPAEIDDTNVIQFAACGAPLNNHQVRIVDAANQELPERQEGQLQFRGPSATSGYFRNPEKTNQLFSDGWLNTGDLAYIAGGEIYLTGRVKDIIIKAGRNLYPDELEEAIGNLKRIRKGRVAVFGSKHPETGTERLVVLAETREKHAEELAAIRSQINILTSDLIGSLPDDIVLAPPNTVLKTSSGKIRRAASREVYERGQVGKKPKALWWQILRVATSGLLPQIRSSRQLITRLSYGLYARTIFWIIAPIVWLSTAILPNAKHRWAIMRKGTRLLAKWTFTPIFIHGEEKLPPPEQPCVYVANHASYLDGPLLVMLLGQRFSFIAKSELLQSFVSRVFLRRIDTEFVERFDIEKGVADTERLGNIAKAGKSLLFFPEGTFTRVPGLLPFHMGAFIIAAKANLPIVPIIMRGTRSIFRAESWLPNHGKITFRIIDPIEVSSKDEENPPDIWQTALDLRNKTREVMLKHCSEPDLASN
jgi:1-acyl-sn-glycerol-3-phosphate acyltransferase